MGYFRYFSVLILGGVVWVSTSMALANINYDESTQQDLSGDFESPTSLGVLGIGSNLVSGTSTAGDVVELPPAVPAPHFPNLDADVWTVEVAPNTQMDQVVLTHFEFTPTNLLGGENGSGAWFAVEASGQISDPMSPDALLGGGLVGMIPGQQQGDNVLEGLGLATMGGAGFSGPLAAGTYTFWYQEGPTDTSYTFDFQVSEIPEPSTLVLFGLGCCFFGLRRRR